MKSNKIRLGEQCVVTSSKRFHLSERITQGVPFYCSKEIIKKFNGEDVTECDYISEDLYKKVSNEFGVPKENDLLITTRGTIGIPYLYKRTDRFYFADGNLTWIKDFDSNLYSKFLYYWFQSYEGRKKFEALAKGTAQKAVPISGIKTLEIELPSLKSQKRIADILSAYDDLIENNRKQIKLLEEAAQRLYKEWFVDLHFPGHENTKIVDGVPEGWSKNPIQDFISYEIGGGWGEELQNEKSMIPAYVIRGTDIKGLVNGQLQSVPYRYHTAGSLETRKLLDGDIVFEVSGGSKTEGVARTVRIIDLMLKTWDNSVICASFCKRIKPIPSFSQYLNDSFRWMRLNGKTQEYDKKSASSIVNYRWKDFLAQEKILKPDEETISQYNNIAGTIYTKIIVCSCQIEQAKMKRDLLLPKLMSGELEV